MPGAAGVDGALGLSAPITFTAPSLASFRYRPVPEMVPPVPTPATKWVIFPSICSHSSGPVEW
ncbi:hypothetical protein STENM327S_04609 [Streptomyces tendae]